MSAIEEELKVLLSKEKYIAELRVEPSNKLKFLVNDKLPEVKHQIKNLEGSFGSLLETTRQGAVLALEEIQINGELGLLNKKSLISDLYIKENQSLKSLVETLQKEIEDLKNTNECSIQLQSKVKNLEDCLVKVEKELETILNRFMATKEELKVAEEKIEVMKIEKTRQEVDSQKVRYQMKELEDSRDQLAKINSVTNESLAKAAL